MSGFSDGFDAYLQKSLAGLAGLLVCALFPVAAQSGPLEERRNDPRIAEIITTGVREQLLATLPRSANVITAEDIALSPSTNIVDLLAREANLNLRSTVGNEKFSGVDIRGQGDTYVSNVLVLVDGFRLNSADLSGADYSTIPLDQIERIEVIRGANTVRYGNGAVAGVINIITRDPQPGLGISARLRAGSFSTVDAGAGAAWGGDKFSLGADAAYSDTDGYRDNSGLEKKDFLAKAGFTPAEWLDMDFTASSHWDKFGLPGPVSESDFNGSEDDRQSTNFPDDGGETNDDRLRVDVSMGNKSVGVLRMTALVRDRENLFRFNADPDSPFSLIREDNQEFQSQYDFDFSLLSLNHSVYVGVELRDTEYSRGWEEILVDDDVKRGDIDQRAWFVAADISLSAVLNLSLGYRQDRSDVTTRDEIYDDELCDDPVFFPPLPEPIDCNDPGGFRTGFELVDETQDTWRNHAFEAGLVYSPSDTTNWFVSYAQSFRNPNVDELIFTVEEEGLIPQTGDHWDAGVRKLWGQSVETSLAIFYVHTENEIVFAIGPNNDPANLNLDEPSTRKGGEGDLRWYALRSLTLTANVGYTDAEFSETESWVPLVPEWTGAVGLEWQPADAWVLTVAGNYVGERGDGNDFSNQNPKIDAYQVVDAKLSYYQGSLQLYAGVNNIFDEVYAASVYSNQYYPMPTRNYYAGVAYRM